MSNQTKASAAGTVKAGEEKVQQAAEIVKDGAAQALDSCKKAATQIRERTSEQLDEWGNTVSEYAEESLREFRDLEESLAKHIREKPVSTILMVAGCAFVLGAIWRGR